jgi:DNA polymerase-3 subunit alpha
MQGLARLHGASADRPGPKMAFMFVHLRLHTEFSVVDGTNRIDEIVAAAAADRQPALAITDLSNLFGTVKFYKEARGAGVKPLIGADIWVQVPGKDAGAPAARLLLLVQNRQGYLNLSEILTRAWTKNVVRDQAVVKLEWLQELNEGLIALSGAQGGAVGQALLQGDSARAVECALYFGGLFPPPLLPGAATRPAARRRAPCGGRRAAGGAAQAAGGGHASGAVPDLRRLRGA